VDQSVIQIASDQEDSGRLVIDPEAAFQVAVIAWRPAPRVIGDDAGPDYSTRLAWTALAAKIVSL